MKNKKKVIAAIIVIVLVIAVAGINSMRKSSLANAPGMNFSSETEYTVARDDISVSVSESGNVNPTDKRIIKSEINGTVESIYVTEGDQIEKDQILTSLKSETSSGSQTEINSIKLNIEKAKRELNDLYSNQGELNIYAPVSGVISGLSIENGNQISANYDIASIKDTDNSYIEVYFTKEQFDNISISDSVSIFMTKYFSTETGTVVEKDSTPVQMGGGTFGYLVTVKMSNPGGYSVGDLAQITVSNAQGSYQGMSTGEIIDVKEEKVTSKVSGKIKTVNVENGKYVNKGDVIATIEGDDISLQIAEKQNAIEKYNSQIEDLVEGDTIFSPMKGTILKIDVSEDEVVDRTTALMTVADLDSMEVKISVDELDINKIKLDQPANITCDVYPNEKFTGKVSKISMEGNTQSGVTTYDVTIKLDDRKSLMSGMNVDVEILADSKENVLIIPIDAVNRLNGDYVVTVKDAAGNKTDVKVELGLATKKKVEILSGLNEGDVIVYRASQSPDMMPGGMMMMPAGGGNAVIRQEGPRQ
ncbi:efflux RND transporter periplasmic adaptor subunit [Sedimentibacter hydroxybenzoicus DSM 7310]|uniref:Efflux RND transporter periplasmic adaptor subunit n=1 Tax=Sedimentibacter hydroxybenzoicus DSM 7310 TaxID=1123245 RepID=A0A974GX05_SEDHY|nr:efflux RND transporter periplasmic adaptor subunit [Sedimentibacter hydroxybenzoicus]NYB75008.1 efflux RND transporter periplasmic adaptor subunit [Sedimentibacter hydroxybenzoicus DSM 7310]